MLLLPIGSFFIGWSFDHEYILIGDAAVIVRQSFDARMNDRISEASSSWSCIDGCILHTIYDDIDTVTAVGEHDLETIQHLQFFLRHHKPTVPVLQCHH